MHTTFRWSRLLVFLAVVALIVATVAVFVFGLISTVVVVVEAFRHGPYNAEGARHLSVELIEMIDLFLLGTILLITAIGLQELFIDPGLKEVLPEWMSVKSLDELKFNLLIVVVVMLAVLFLGVIAGFELTEGASVLDYGLAVAAVVTGLGIVTYLFAKVHQAGEGHAEAVDAREEAYEGHEVVEGH